MSCNFLHKSKKSQRCQLPKKQHSFKGKRQREKRKHHGSIWANYLVSFLDETIVCGGCV